MTKIADVSMHGLQVSAWVYSAWSPAYRSQLQAGDCDDEEDVLWPLQAGTSPHRPTPKTDFTRHKGVLDSLWLIIKERVEKKSENNLRRRKSLLDSLQLEKKVDQRKKNPKTTLEGVEMF